MHIIFFIISQRWIKQTNKKTKWCDMEEKPKEERWKIIADKCKYDFLVSISNHVMVVRALDYGVSLITTGM